MQSVVSRLGLEKDDRATFAAMAISARKTGKKDLQSAFPDSIHPLLCYSN